MQPSHRRRAAFVLIALVVGVFLSRGDVTMGAGTFTASTSVALSSTALSANADTTFTLTVPAPDLSPGDFIHSTPGAASIAPGPGNPAFVSGTHPALGDVVGTLSFDPDLGLANGPCGPAPASPFTFLNATVDITDTIDPVPPAATNPGSGGTLDT